MWLLVLVSFGTGTEVAILDSLVPVPKLTITSINKKEKMMYYTYMLRCKDNSIYTGITTNIEHRMIEHFTKVNGAKYTYTHTAKKLEAVWQTENRALASKLEYRIKHLTKIKKEELISKNNLEELLYENLDCSQYKRVEDLSVFINENSTA